MFNATIIKGFITKQAKIKEEDISLFNVHLPKGDVKRNLQEYKIS